MSALVVISGPPSSGKSTLIRMLADAGYPVIEEQAEVVINEGKLSPFRDGEKDLFQEEVLTRQLSLEASFLDRDPLVFLDRGVFDGEAYSEVSNLASISLYRELDGSRYRVMFLLEPLPIFERTAVRQDDPNVVSKLFYAIEKAYLNHGVMVIRVPVLSASERLAFILHHMHELIGRRQ